MSWHDLRFAFFSLPVLRQGCCPSLFSLLGTFIADFQLRERNGQSLDVTVLEHRPSGLGVCIFLITCFIAAACNLVKKIHAMFLSLDLYCITIKIKNVRVSSNSNKPKD